MDANTSNHDADNTFDTSDLADALPTTPDTKQKSHTKPSLKPSASSALKAKQANRKFRSTTLPSPSLNIPLNDFTSFTACLQSSKLIFALIGAGLSASSGLATYRGTDARLWRGVDPQSLRNIESFWEDPVLVWWLFSDRMKGAQEAAPNSGHRALAKLAKEKGEEGFFAVNQNIDGLLQRASFLSSQIAQIHGSLFDIKCSRNIPGRTDRCTYTAPSTYPVSPGLAIHSDIDIADPSTPLPPLTRADLPHCPLCQSLLRPAVVLFGESYDSGMTDKIWDFHSAGPIDLMLCGGHECDGTAGGAVYYDWEECGGEGGVF